VVNADDPQQLRARADAILQLHEDGDLDEALDACDELLLAADAFPITDPVVRESVFTARFERALLLMELGDLEAAGHAHREAADTPADLDDPDQRHEIAMALLNGGVCHDAVGDHQGALDAYAELVSPFGQAEHPVTHAHVIPRREKQ
jgi:tetratricopeptide (TPR) repeat protein